MNKILLNKDVSVKSNAKISEKINVENSVFLHQIAKIFCSTSLQKPIFNFIEHVFQMVVGTNCFLESDYDFVSKLLASSNLQIDSEVEVYNSLNKWLSYDGEKRTKFAKQLLLKIRLYLLSDKCLKYLVNESSSITMNNECNEIISNMDSFYKSKSIVHYKRRLNSQNMFNILICGGLRKHKSHSSDVKQIDVKNFEKIHFLPSMMKRRHLLHSIYVKGEVYVFDGYHGSRTKSVERYSFKNKTWNKVTDLPDERQFFCACAFMDKIYLFGGRIYNHRIKYGYYVTRSCLELNTKHLEWKEVASMYNAKEFAACAVFEESIVVAGGKTIFNSNRVEIYDVFADTWTKIPNMIEERSGHSLVCVKSKLFAIGGYYTKGSSEVFDKLCNKFVLLISPKLHSSGTKAVSIGSRLYVFQNESKIVLCYDVDKDEWSEISCEATENISYFSSVRVPSY